MTTNRRTYLTRIGAVATAFLAGCSGSNSSNSTTSVGSSEEDADVTTSKTASGPKEMSVESSIENALSDSTEVLERTAYRSKKQMGVEATVKVTDPAGILGPFTVAAEAYDSDDVELDSGIEMINEYEEGEKYQVRIDLGEVNPDNVARYVLQVKE